MLDLNGFGKKEEKKTQYQFTQLLKSSLSTIVCVCERERERGGCCVASLKKNLPSTFLLM